MRACLDVVSFEWYHSVFCFHHSNHVGPTEEHLFGWVLDYYFHHSILWFLSDELWKLKTYLGVFSFHNFVFNGISVIKHTLRNPLVKSVAKIFFFFLIVFGEFGYWGLKEKEEEVTVTAALSDRYGAYKQLKNIEWW